MNKSQKQVSVLALLLWSCLDFSAQVIGSGSLHSVALCNDSTVWLWGDNFSGQLGNYSYDSSYTPTETSPIFAFKATKVVAGGYFTLALIQDGTVWSWGDNNYGQLGDGTTTNRNHPVMVEGIEDVIDIAAGESQSFALRSDGTVWGWGRNGYVCLLGNGIADTTGCYCQTLPVQVSGLEGITAIAAGFEHTLALGSDSTVWAWGVNSKGQCGDGTLENRSTPVLVNTINNICCLQDVIAIAAPHAGNHSLALKSDGTLRAWGSNDQGQLGNGEYTTDECACEPYPVKVVAGNKSGCDVDLCGIKSVSAGERHSLALDSTGRVWSWGRNSIIGQLGIGVATDTGDPNCEYCEVLPLQVHGINNVGFLENVVEISTGNLHSMALLQDGTVCSWGWNGFGQLGIGFSSLSSLHPLQLDALCTVVPNSTNDYQILNFNAFPNPTDHNLTLEFAVMSEYTVELVNALGQQIISFSSFTNLLDINLSDIENGIYFLKVTNKSRQFGIKKIMKN